MKKIISSLLKRGFAFVPDSIRDSFFVECEEMGITPCGGAFEDRLYKEPGQYFYRY